MMPLRLLYLTIVLLFFCNDSVAQNLVSGCVVDSMGLALSSVVVKVYARKGSKMSAYTLTRNDGTYRLELKEDWFPVRITYSHLGFRKHSITLSNPVKVLSEVRMDNEDVRLKEVTVMNVPIRSHGDTLVYNVAAFTSVADRNIEDVLKKMPGITIDRSGQISYRGEAINKFYIEGLDLLSGRYSLATKNISPADIASVSVYENHQPKRVLKDIEFSEKAALNLKLKNNRMLKPIGTLTLGAGIGDEALFKGELFGMFIGPQMQHLITAKENNSGSTYANETSVLATDGFIQDNTEAWNVFPRIPFGTASVPAERYYMNHSVSSSFNSLLKLKSDFTLTVNGDYAFDHYEADNGKITEYAGTIGNNIIVTENNAQRNTQQTANLNVKAEKNAEKTYLFEKLSARLRFKRDIYSLKSDRLLTQKQRTNDLNLKNTLSTVVKNGRRVWQFDSKISFSTTPLNNILVRYPVQDSTLFVQQAEGVSLRTNESTAFHWLLGQCSDLSIGLAFESAYDSFKSSLLRDDNGNKNDNYGFSLLTTVKPTYQYRAEKLRLTITVPLMVRNISYKDAMNSSRFILNKPYVGLQSTLRYFFLSNLSTSLNMSYNNTVGGLTDFVVNPIFTTYRTKTTFGTGKLNLRNAFTVISITDYRNTLEGLFLTLRAFYRRGRSDVMRNRMASAEETVSATVKRVNTTTTWSVYAYTAKTLNHPDVTLSITGNAMSSNRKLMIQGAVCNIRNSVYNATFDANGSFLNDILAATFTCCYVRTIQNIESCNTQDEASSSLKISVSPLKNIELYANSDLKINDIGGKRNHTYLFVDGGLRFIGKHLEIEMALRNLTNRTFYATKTFLEDEILTYFYSMRPAECLLTVKLKL